MIFCAKFVPFCAESLPGCRILGGEAGDGEGIIVSAYRSARQSDSAAYKDYRRVGRSEVPVLKPRRAGWHPVSGR